MKTTLKPILIPFLLFSSSLIFAEDNPFDPGQDPGIIPINDCILPILLLGIVLGYFLIKKKKIA